MMTDLRTVRSRTICITEESCITPSPVSFVRQTAGGDNSRDAKDGSPSDSTTATPSDAASTTTTSDAGAKPATNPGVNSAAFFNVGSKASAYRELAAIAIELNQPDLVYKFIFLAHKNSSLKTPGWWRRKRSFVRFLCLRVLRRLKVLRNSWRKKKRSKKRRAGKKQEKGRREEETKEREKEE